MIILAEVPLTIGPALPQLISLVLAVRAVWISVVLVPLPAPVTLGSMWCAENPVSGVCTL